MQVRLYLANMFKNKIRCGLYRFPLSRLPSNFGEERMSPIFKGYSSTNGTESKNGDEVHKRKPAGVEGSFCKVISRKI